MTDWLQGIFGLDGKVAIVTGGGGGIGRALSLGLAQGGARVVVADLIWEKAARVITEFSGLRVHGLAVKADISKAADVDHMIQQALTAYGQLDILVNNAGIYPSSPVESMPEGEWQRVLDTNLKGTFLCSRAAVRRMIPRRHGRIVNIASGRALAGAAGGAHYASSKAGILGFTRSLALEMAAHGITVNAVTPGVTDTDQPRAHYTEEQLQAVGKRIPLGRIGQPDDLVGAVLFLASEAGRFVTGQNLVVNGGQIFL
ncbi:MAG: 3-oxoacyl-ACP reductase FabG [Deltaproteobacteria bacterium]|nr:3-oxoacyl-ACP reductase FabG [Deltaproteobacteria bacterium]